MQKVQAIVLGGALMALLVIGAFLRYRSISSNRVQHDDRLQVVATFYPVAEFAKQVGGEDIQLTQLVPDGIEPHEYEPTAQQIALASSADVFIMNGGSVDAWALEVAQAVNERGGKPLRMSDAIELTDGDPHIWLEPSRAKQMVQELESAFIAADEEHRDAYVTRSTSYQHVLDSLDRSYSIGLEQCSLRDIIVSHDAFGYLSTRYTFRVHHILGVSPEEEPSVKAITELAQLAKRLKIKTIFFETLVSPKLAQTLAGEVGAKAEVLNPIEGLTIEERKTGRSYIDSSLENLAKLKTAMMCQ